MKTDFHVIAKLSQDARYRRGLSVFYFPPSIIAGYRQAERLVNRPKEFTVRREIRDVSVVSATASATHSREQNL